MIANDYKSRRSEQKRMEKHAKRCRRWTGREQSVGVLTQKRTKLDQNDENLGPIRLSKESGKLVFKSKWKTQERKKERIRV